MKTAIEAIGADHVMFETDFPHPTCLYPGPLEALERSMQGVDAATRKLILQDTAAGLYHVDLAA